MRTPPPFEHLAAKVEKVTHKASPIFGAERERAIWNKRLDATRQPDAIIRVRSVEEVVRAVRFAAEHLLKVSPRGSGHHYGAAALRDGGLLLDLTDLDYVEIDTEARVVRVGAGIRGDDLSARLAEFGFAFPIGHCADVSVSGYILNGGFGWNAGEWGAACANVVAIEMVTADGEIVVASEGSHPDLFWAARGAGPGFFAAITAYHLKLHPLPKATCAWRGAFPVASAPLLADWLTAATESASYQTEIGCFLMSHWETGEPAVVLRVSACGSDEAEARSRLSSFMSIPAGVTTIGRPSTEALSFTELFRLSPMPAGKRVAADHLWSTATLGQLLLAVHDLTVPSPHSTVDLVAYGGHSSVTLPSNAALSLGGGTGAGIYAMWDDPSQDEINRTWVRRVDEALSPFRSGRYVGEADLTATPGRLAECFTSEALQRLRQLRAQYDPNRLFFAWP